MTNSQSADDTRHLAPERIEAYLQARVPGLVRIAGAPAAYLVIDPADAHLAIQVAANGPVPDVGRYERLTALTIHRDGQQWHELRISRTDRLVDLYPLLRLVLDRIQLHRASFAAAVQDALQTYGSLLTTRPMLTESQQTGLFGELLVVDHLIRKLGPDGAVAAWADTPNAEHDFSLVDGDLEVKTTSTEARHHWISSATQMCPLPGRTLHLLSIQITRGGAEHGRTLPALAGEVAAASGSMRQEFERRLHVRGFQADDAYLYPAVWSMRSRPAVYLVDDNFPALTPARLAATVPDAHRLLEYRYRLDLTGLRPANPPTAINGLTNGSST